MILNFSKKNNTTESFILNILSQIFKDLIIKITLKITTSIEYCYKDFKLLIKAWIK